MERTLQNSDAKWEWSFKDQNPFPLSIYGNIAYGFRIHGIKKDSYMDDVVERCLSSVLLWNEVKYRLRDNALTLSLEQQQRLCIARVLVVKPEIILMDEPCSTLDPVATLQIEELIRSLGKEYTVVIVTHNMQQAARVSTMTGFMLL
jgi:phosphate transport system ATP-binding protein